jgi:hypothetical protein
LNTRLSLTTTETGVSKMAVSKSTRSSSVAVTDDLYDGKLIVSLFELVEKAEKRFQADDDGSHPKSRE